MEHVSYILDFVRAKRLIFHIFKVFMNDHGYFSVAKTISIRLCYPSNRGGRQENNGLDKTIYTLLGISV